MNQDKGFVRNNTKIPQLYGSHAIPPSGVGTLPMEIIESLRQYPLAELTVLSGNEEEWVFKQTEHLPFSPRYMERR